MNLTTYEEDVFYDTPYAYIKIVDWIQRGDEVIFRCGWAYDERWGEEIIPALKERMFAWNGERFELEEEKILRGLKYIN